MKAQHPRKLAVLIRDICNHWPQYSYMRNIPKHSLWIDLEYETQGLTPEQEAYFEASMALEAAHDKQAYLQSLHTN